MQKQASKHVVVAQRMSDFVDVFAQWIRDAGYEVRVCTGPNGPGHECWGYRSHGCPLWNQADLLVYDPWLATGYDGTTAFSEECARHPDTPVLLWGAGALPADVSAAAKANNMEVLPQDISPRVLVAAIEQHIGLPDPKPQNENRR